MPHDFDRGKRGPLVPREHQIWAGRRPNSCGPTVNVFGRTPRTMKNPAKETIFVRKKMTLIIYW